MFKRHYIKSYYRVLRKNQVDTYGAPVFGPYNSVTVLAVKCVLTLMSFLCILDFYGVKEGGCFIQ
jgi:hypothetical protein